MARRAAGGKQISLVGLAVWLGVISVARANDPPGIELADGEIGYDADAQEFNAAIPYGKEVPIVLIEPKGSSANIEVWRLPWKKDSKGCGDAPPAKRKDQRDQGKFPVASLAATPVGPEVDGKQKLVARIPKLWPAARYCFKIDVTRKRELGTREAAQLASALSKGVETLIEDDYDPTKYTSACNSLGSSSDLKGSKIPRCAVVAAIYEQLPPSLQTLQIYDAVDKKTVGALEALYAFIDEPKENPELIELINEQISVAVTARYSAGLLTSEHAEAVALAPVPKNSDPIYDPIYDVTTKELCAAITDPPTKTELCQKKRPAFVSAVYAKRELLKPTGSGQLRNNLPTADEAALQQFLTAQEEAKVVPITGAELARALQTAVGPGSYADRLKEFDKTAAKMSAMQLDADTNNWRSPGHGIPPKKLRNLEAKLLNMKDALEALVAGDKAVDTVKKDKAFEAFSAVVFRVQVYLGAPKSVSPTTGTFENRFPFYASLDVGGAALGFNHEVWDIAQYFGVNLYLGPVDPDEPLGTNDTFGRGLVKRFSVTVGVTTTGESNLSSKDVSGAMGKQFILCGGGFRLLEFLRLSAGTFLYRQPSNANPTRPRPEVKAGGYIGFSLDVAAFKRIREGYKSLSSGGS